MRAIPYHKIATLTMTKSLWHKNNTVEERLTRKPSPPLQKKKSRIATPDP